MLWQDSCMGATGVPWGPMGSVSVCGNLAGSIKVATPLTQRPLATKPIAVIVVDISTTVNRFNISNLELSTLIVLVVITSKNVAESLTLRLSIAKLAHSARARPAIHAGQQGQRNRSTIIRTPRPHVLQYINGHCHSRCCRYTCRCCRSRGCYDADRMTRQQRRPSSRLRLRLLLPLPTLRLPCPQQLPFDDSDEVDNRNGNDVVDGVTCDLYMLLPAPTPRM